jgi:soluble lytic murein transglycosylase-like protein
MKVFAVAMALAVVSTPALARSKTHHHKHARHHARMVVMEPQPFAGAPWMGAAAAEPQRRMTRSERRAMMRAQMQAQTPGFGAPAFGAPRRGFDAYAAVPRSATRGQGAGQGAYAAMVQRHAAANGIPASLVHRVIMRESRYNPRAVSKGNYGIMQIRLGTARAMGYTGSAAGLLDPEVNMTYAVKYLAGAYKVSGGSESGAVANYARGYYAKAKRRGVSPYEAPGGTRFGGPSYAVAGFASAPGTVAAMRAVDRHTVF